MPRRLTDRFPRFLYHSLLATGLAAVACAEARAGDAGGGLGTAVPFVVGAMIVVGIGVAGYLVVGGKLTGAGGATAATGATPEPTATPFQPGEGPLARGPWMEPPDMKRGPNPMHKLILPGILVAAAIAGAVPGFLYIMQLYSAGSKMQQMVKPGPAAFPQVDFNKQFDWNKQFGSPVWSPPQQDLPVVVQPIGPAVPGK